ncbi:ADP-ribose glycohydrolase MACROD2 [Physcia stellaris]|nr:ADP-ribose glycohydrolase MACROD2 [Physcia stellaris]
MSSDVITLSEIPTISELYKSSELQPAPPDSSTPEPSGSLNSKVALIRTSITDLKVTSIVNAANRSLLGGGGVDGAIHRAAGPSLLSECRTLNGCSTGSAKITTAHALPSSYIIHAVGPVYSSTLRQSPTLPAELLAGCYKTSLELAAEKGGSIAFSCLSTGVYGYPSQEAAEVALGVVRGWLLDSAEKGKGGGREGEGKGLERVIFCCFEAKDERAYKVLIPKFFPPTPSDLPSATSAPTATATEPDSEPGEPPAPLDTQASSLIAAAEKSANNESPNAKKLKVTNPDPDVGDDWETIEKPEDFLADEDPKPAVDAEGAKEVADGKGEREGEGSLGKNALLKDW